MIRRQLHLRERIEYAFPSSSLDSETNQPEVRQLGEDYPSLPDEYLSFQLTVGCGTIGQSKYQLYGSAQEPDEVFEHPSGTPDAALLVGDDCSGNYIGYSESRLFIYDSTLGTSQWFAGGITDYMETWLAGQEPEEGGWGLGHIELNR